MLNREWVPGEFSDGDRRAGQRKGWDDRVDAGTIGQARVDHRRTLIATPSKWTDDAIDDALDVVVVVEPDIGLVEPAFPLDVDRLWPIYHNLGDGVVLE